MMSSNTFLPLVLSSPGAIAFKIGSWPIRWYGIFIALGFLVVYFLAEHLVKKNNLDLNYFNDSLFIILIFSVVCARLYFVFLSWDYFQYHLDEIPKIWYGGQSIHGGILGAIAATVLYSKIKKFSFFYYMDILAAVAPIGQAIGRWGNFFNNEAFGKPTSNPVLRLHVPTEFRPEVFINNEYFHPTFFYESVLNLIIFIFLYKKYSLWKSKPGKTFWVYLLSYSTVRFFLEFIRVDSLYLFDHFASAHILSVAIIVISVIFLRKQ